MTYDGRPDNFQDVGAFHQKFGLEVSNRGNAGPREVTPELLEFRIKFMLEELLEFIEGCGMELLGDGDNNSLSLIIPADFEVDHAKTFDALLDLAYVVFGTAHLMGYPWQEGWNEVQRANMTKVRAAADGSDSKRGSSLDVVKPEGWTAPDIGEVLRRHGFRTPDED